jgi:hypothetical protein
MCKADRIDEIGYDTKRRLGQWDHVQADAGWQRGSHLKNLRIDCEEKEDYRKIEDIEGLF